MSSSLSSSQPQPPLSQPSIANNDPSKSQIDTATQEPNLLGHSSSSDPSVFRPFRLYTKQDLLYLSYSPMVQCPTSMPELKVWFGSETDVVLKKDEPQTPNTARERRFRRDGEEGADPASARLPYRPNAAQPMGNFKHQSLRPNDRERDRDGEREKDRDTRDKEGLRHLSDKYDRDRLAMPPNSARNKEREGAPHLASNSRTSQATTVNSSSRRTDGRDAAKKKTVEAGEDWRRGAEPPRSSRDDQSGRRDREDRERPRSRVRDSSRHRRDASTTRREKDREDHRRDKDDGRKDRDVDEDDARRWRDDPKREERLTTRRGDRVRDRNGEHWEHVQDRRWPAGDDRDSRYKRAGPRDRKGNGSEDIRDKDDRKDRDRKEEKEPAWMDTYIPSETSPGILGGAIVGGELDGIQAWKKGLKEKETKEKPAPPAQTQPDAPVPQGESKTERPAMDEIQLFKMLMKQEAEKKPMDDTGAAEGPSKSAGAEAEKIVTGVVAPTSKPFDHSEATFASSTTQDTHAVEKVINLTDLPGERTVPRLASITTPQAQDPHSQTTGSFQPPTGSRLLAFARTSQKNAVPTGQINDGDALAQPPRNGFSPFEDPNRHAMPIDEGREPLANLPPHLNQRSNVDAPYRTSLSPINDLSHNGTVSAKGSRFAKFFDEKGREGQQSVGKAPTQVPTHYPSQSPAINQRPDPNPYGMINVNANDHRTMEDLFAMLNTSSQQQQRGNMGQSHLPSLVNQQNPHFNPQGPLPNNVPQHLLHQQAHQARLEPLYDSRNEDRSFVPDGMVPGLRPIPPPMPRRETLGHFPEHADDQSHFTLQRLLAQQQQQQQQQQLQQQQQQQQQQQGRNIESLYAGPNSSYGQGGRHIGHPLQALQQPLYRGGPSPGLNQPTQPSNVPHPQRLPPGLANLGGRPPHEPNQFVGLQNLPTTSSHTMHINPQQAQQQIPFAGFNNTVYNNQSRPNLPGGHIPNLPQHALNGLGLPNVDPRLSTTHPLLALNGGNIAGNRMNGGFPPAPNATPHMLRPQQQQQPGIHPQMLPHLLPPHLHQQTHSIPNNQPAHDLMALLMGGTHRE